MAHRQSHGHELSSDIFFYRWLVFLLVSAGWESGVEPPHSKGKVPAVIDRRYKRWSAEN
jgi:hypothetical protein